MSVQGISITADEKQRESVEKVLADPFDLFTKPTIEQDHLGKREVKIRPSIPITEDGDIIFEIKTHGMYLDSNSIEQEYFLKIRNEDGLTDMSASDDVAPINMIAATFWKDIKVSFRSVTKVIPTLEFYVFLILGGN